MNTPKLVLITNNNLTGLFFWVRYSTITKTDETLRWKSVCTQMHPVKFFLMKKAIKFDVWGGEASRPSGFPLSQPCQCFFFIWLRETDTGGLYSPSDVLKAAVWR